MKHPCSKCNKNEAISQYAEHCADCSKAESDNKEKEFLSRRPPTLRDRFAMAALTGLVMKPTQSKIADLAQVAYGFADEMLKAREVRTDV